jgi:hypothetical protein
MELKILINGEEFICRLNKSKTAKMLWEKLPIQSKAKIWGKEVYFQIPLKATQEDPQADVPPGTVAYWPPGEALCLFFGQKPYSPVNVVGELKCDPKLLERIKEGMSVKLIKAHEEDKKGPCCL